MPDISSPWWPIENQRGLPNGLRSRFFWVLKKEIRYIPPGFDWAVFQLIYIYIYILNYIYSIYIIYIYIYIILNRYYI